MLVSTPVAFNDTQRERIIPVWARSFGSWNISIGRRPFAVRELEAHYDKASDSWHTTISKLGFESAYAGLVDYALPALSKVGQARPLRVLEAGIGTGAFSAAFADRFPQPIKLTGVDISKDMLRQADAHLKNCGLTAQLMQGDITDLPFADQTFNVILVAHVIEHMADPKAALAELNRVLKPGGVLLGCITQRSTAGAYIQMKWRTHRADTATATHWFEERDFHDVQTVQLTRSASAQRLSMGYVACKLGPSGAEAN